MHRAPTKMFQLIPTNMNYLAINSAFPIIVPKMKSRVKAFLNCSKPKKLPNLSKMSDTYGHYTPKDIDVYVNNIIGSYRSELEGMTFSDRRQTSYLEAHKYNAELIWEECNTHKQSLVNIDVLDTVLLSLHPACLLTDKDISNNTR